MTKIDIKIGKTHRMGGACKHGNIAARRISDGKCTCRQCTDEVTAKRRDRRRQAAALKPPREKRPPKPRAPRKPLNVAQKERRREAARAWRKANPEKVREHSRRAARILKMRDPERAASYQKKWASNNPENGRARFQKRRAAKIQAIPVWFGEFDELVMAEAASLAKTREAATGHPWHIDHMIPLQAREASGLHCASNIQVIPARLNMVKRNKMILTAPGEWIGAI